MIRLIATDLDGTLLNSRCEISERNAKAIRRAMDRGVIVCIASGRIHATCKPYHDALALNGPIIAVNGARIQRGDEIIGRSLIPPEHFEQGMRLGEKHGICPMTVCGDRMTYLSEHRDYLSPIINFYEDSSFFEELSSSAQMLERIRASGTERLSFICFEDSKLMPLREELVELYGGFLEVSSSWPNNLEISKAGISKGYALELVAKMYGVKREETMALGDHDNDASMLKYAGVSVAMGNALDSLKRVAGLVTDHHDDDGFAKAVEKFVDV